MDKLSVEDIQGDEVDVTPYLRVVMAPVDAPEEDEDDFPY